MLYDLHIKIMLNNRIFKSNLQVACPGTIVLCEYHKCKAFDNQAQEAGNCHREDFYAENKHEKCLSLAVSHL